MPRTRAGGPSRVRLPAALLMIAALLALSGAPSVARGVVETDLEREVKAAYLYNFLRFTEWPAGEDGAASREITIALLADPKFGDVVERTIAGKTAQGLPVRVRRFRTLEELRAGHHGVHLLFLGPEVDVSSVFSALSGHPVLTVGESPGFCLRGGIIALVRDGERLAFEINAEAARRSGLRLSSKLLGLARLICTESAP